MFEKLNADIADDLAAMTRLVKKIEQRVAQDLSGQNVEVKIACNQKNPTAARAGRAVVSLSPWGALIGVTVHMPTSQARGSRKFRTVGLKQIVGYLPADHWE